MAYGRIHEVPWLRAALAYYMLCLHAILVTVLVTSMIYLVDGIKVNNGKENSDRFSDGKTYWLASDITTLVSVALVTVKVVTGSWCSISAWRCAFILMEKSESGLKLQQLNKMVSWKLPWKWDGKHSWVIATVLLLMFPSTIVAPVLSGAVNWRSVQVLVDGGSTPASSGIPDNWFWYLTSAMNRIENGSLPTVAAGLAGLAWSTTDQADEDGCRHVVNDGHLPVDSTLESATLPCIKIHDISFDEYPQPKVVTDIIDHSEKVSLIGQIPFGSYHPGNGILFDSTTWNNSFSDSESKAQWVPLPPPTIFSGQKKFAILIDRQIQTSNGCSPMIGGVFGNDTVMEQLEKYKHSWDRFAPDEICFVVGTINFTAGVVKSSISTYVSSRAVEATRDLPIEQGLFVSDALYMMPDVMPLVSLLNTSEIRTWNDLEGYTKRLIRYSYMSSWDALNNAYGPPSPVELKANKAVNMLEASVLAWRVYLWAFINSLLTLSGVILLVAQNHCARPVVVDVAAAAITMDAGKMGESQNRDLKDLSYVTKEDDSDGKRRLRIQPGVYKPVGGAIEGDENPMIFGQDVSARVVTAMSTATSANIRNLTVPQYQNVAEPSLLGKASTLVNRI